MPHRADGVSRAYPTNEPCNPYKVPLPPGRSVVSPPVTSLPRPQCNALLYGCVHHPRHELLQSERLRYQPGNVRMSPACCLHELRDIAGHVASWAEEKRVKDDSPSAGCDATVEGLLDGGLSHFHVRRLMKRAIMGRQEEIKPRKTSKTGARQRRDRGETETRQDYEGKQN